MVAVAIAPHYAAAPLGRRHAPPNARPPDEYQPCLRLDFDYRCVYCLATEREVAPTSVRGRFEVEHFQPQGDRRFQHLRCYYPNLLWACQDCNRVKGVRWPSDAEIAEGWRFVDPATEALGTHLPLAGERAVPANGSRPGAYIIHEIQLNSPAPLTQRQRRHQR